MLLNHRISFLSRMRSKYDHYLPCQLKALFICPHQSTHFQELKFLWRKHPSARSHHAFHVQKPTRIETSIRPPPSEQLLSSNDSKYWTRWSFATNGSGQLTQRTEHFVRMRSLDECRVAVRSRKVDFLSGNARYYVVELMRVARYCVYVSTSAYFTFATKCSFFCWNPALMD